MRSSVIMTLMIMTSLTTGANAQTEWTKYEGNPVLKPGSSDAWDDVDVAFPEVIYDGVTYQMWYAGNDGIYWRIGYATSPDGFTWTKHDSNPVLDVGATGEWDDVWVFPGAVLFDGTTYRMWYMGFDGTFAPSGYATSSDGFTWTKYASNPVLDVGFSEAFDHNTALIRSVLSDGDTLHAWYVGLDGSGERIGYATSTDGLTWDKYAGNPVMDLGPSGSWDGVHVSAPTILFDGSTYEMWYGGSDISGWRTGYATSTDRINWTKSEENPVLNHGPVGSWDEGFAGQPSVLSDGASSIMWYMGRRNAFRQIGYAVSTPGDEITGLPTKYSLSQAYPNPFNSTTTIEFTLPKQGVVSLIVYNLLGQEVASLANNVHQTGSHRVSWDATNFASGIYFYRLQAGEFVQTRKMVLLK